MALNTHTYDPYYKEIFETNILVYLPKLSSHEVENEWNHILIESRGYPHDIQIMASQIYRKHDIDMNLTHNGYNCHILAAQVWNQIKHIDDARQVFMEQFRDMITGSCPQGQTNRYLQTLIAFRIK